jgi:flagellar protein FlaI
MFTALNIISMQSSSYVNGVQRRRTSVVTEVTSNSDRVDLKEVFVWKPITDEFEKKESHILEQIKARHGWSTEQLKKNLQLKQLLLDKMLEHGIRDYNDVVSWLDAFRKNPDKVISLLTSGQPNQKDQK